MKRAVKYTLMISGIISMCICCLFSSPVYAETIRVNFNYWRSRYWIYEQYDLEQYITDYDFTTSYTNMNVYIENGTSTATDDIDESYPAFVVCDTSDHSNSNSIPMNRRCIVFSELSNVYVNNSGNSSAFDNIINYLLGVGTNNPVSATTLNYEVLYKLGYRITNKCQTTYTNLITGTQTCYLFTIQKLKGSDSLNFLSSYTDSNGSISYTNQYAIITGFYMRYDFDVMNLTNVNNNENVDFVDGDYIKWSIPLTFKRKTSRNADPVDEYMIYSYNDLSIKYIENYASDELGDYVSGYTIQVYITGKNPYIIFYSNEYGDNQNIGSMQIDNYSGQSNIYKGIGNDLSSINEHLVTIEDLLSDLQVTEINNIYQDITNEYDVDIDLTLNNIIDDISQNIQDFDFTDEDYQIPETDLQKISGFRLIFTNMIQTMNSNGIGILWFLPLVLLVLGALL